MAENPLDHELTKGMPMLQKVAIFFVLVGEEATVKIFQHLPRHIVEDISTAITQLGSVDKDTSLAILEEFHLYTRTKGFISAGGYDYAKELLYKSLGKNDELFQPPKISIPLNSILDGSYVSLVQDRLYFYQQLSNAGNVDAVNNIEDELLDRFGKLPESAKNLMI